MLCEKCGREMQQVHDMDHFRCAGCNHFHFPEDSEACSDMITPSGKESDMKCPHCPGLSLTFGELLGNRICFCCNCRGYLIGTSAMGKLICMLRSAYDGPEDTPVEICRNELGSRSSCSKCRNNMDTHPYYGPGTVVIDTCNLCKLTWLNYGELVKIVRAPGDRDSAGVFGDHTSVLDALFQFPNAGGV